MFLTPMQYAKHWNVSYSQVLRCIHNGRLAAKQIGVRQFRIDENEQIHVEEFDVNKKDPDFLKALEAL